jgi:hypothetical protein
MELILMHFVLFLLHPPFSENDRLLILAHELSENRRILASLSLFFYLLSFTLSHSSIATLESRKDRID